MADERGSSDSGGDGDSGDGTDSDGDEQDDEGGSGAATPNLEPFREELLKALQGARRTVLQQFPAPSPQRRRCPLRRHPCD